jgi:hypothetical protein
VDPLEGTRVTDPCDQVACRVDAGIPVVLQTLDQVGGISRLGIEVARRRAMSALGSTMTPAETGTPGSRSTPDRHSTRSSRLNPICTNKKSTDRFQEGSARRLVAAPKRIGAGESKDSE